MGKLLEGRFAVVTGGASGLGRAICKSLAEHGASVLVVDKFKKGADEVCAGLTTEGGLKHASLECDVAQMDDVKKLLEFAQKFHNTPPHVVVNSAGIIRDADFLQMTEGQFDEVVAVNLKGTYLVTQAFSRAAVEHKTQQSIINIASILGKVGAAERANYAATKSAVIGLSKSAAAALARKGVRVNALLPGYIVSPMTDAIDDKLLKAACEKIPMGRMGKAEEIADAVIFMASDMSTYMTGAALEITGGFGM